MLLLKIRDGGFDHCLEDFDDSPLLLRRFVFALRTRPRLPHLLADRVQWSLPHLHGSTHERVEIVEVDNFIELREDEIDDVVAIVDHAFRKLQSQEDFDFTDSLASLFAPDPVAPRRDLDVHGSGDYAVRLRRDRGRLLVRRRLLQRS